jgi:hypothetical protein
MILPLLNTSAGPLFPFRGDNIRHRIYAEKYPLATKSRIRLWLENSLSGTILAPAWWTLPVTKTTSQRRSLRTEPVNTGSNILCTFYLIEDRNHYFDFNGPVPLLFSLALHNKYIQLQFNGESGTVLFLVLLWAS